MADEMAKEAERGNFELKVVLSPRSVERLNQILKNGGYKSHVDIIKDSLLVLEKLLKEEIAGSQFYIQRPHARIEPYHIFAPGDRKAAN